MVMTDPIADMLTRIRNALAPSSMQVLMSPLQNNIKMAIADILQEEGFIKDTPALKTVNRVYEDDLAMQSEMVKT